VKGRSAINRRAPLFHSVENMLKMYCTMAQVIVGRKDKTELDDLSSRNGLRH